LECATREIFEEIGYNVKSQLNESHYIKIETLQGKIVKLFLVGDVDEEKAKRDHKGKIDVCLKEVV
jgi:8-oxo-dGTP pyrophosphatase MutT (NUDIX family)